MMRPGFWDSEIGFRDILRQFSPGKRSTRAGGLQETAVELGIFNIGMWRSLVAHLTGGQGVAGSNPVIPTNFRWSIPVTW